MPLTTPRRFYSLIGVQTPFDPTHTLVTSPLFGPLSLAAIRIFLGFFTLITLILTLVWEVQDGSGPQYLSYFTHLSYIGLCAYFWAAGTQGTMFASRLGHRRRSGVVAGEGEGGYGYDPVKYPLQDWPRLAQALHMVLLATIMTYPFLVTAVFWGLLASSATLSSPTAAYTNISVHVLNTVFALFEILFTNTPPPPWLLLPPTIFLLGLYVALAYLSHLTIGHGYYPYSFLDPYTPEHPHIVGAYLGGVLLAYSIVFVLVRGVVVLRVCVVRRTVRVRARRGVEVQTGAREKGEDRTERVQEGLSEWEVL